MIRYNKYVKQMNQKMNVKNLKDFLNLQKNKKNYNLFFQMIN